MKRSLVAPAALLFLASLLLSGCAHHPVYPIAPPPIYQPSPALFDLAGHNGFASGVDDGARDAYYGRRYDPRRTPAYHEAPGYDATLGPAEPYVNTFRNAYLRGYDKGYYRR